MSKLPPALVLDLSATGIAVARILYGHGVEVYGADLSGRCIGKFSRYVKQPHFGNEVRLNSNFLDSLISFSKKFSKKAVLIPSSDVFIEFISNHFQSLKHYYNLQDSLHPQVSIDYLNKRKFYSLCDKFGVSYPKTIFIGGHKKIEYILDYLRLPIILKPNLIHKWKRYLKGNKVIKIESKNKLKEILDKEKELLKDSMLQEVIPGPEDNIYLFKGYFDREGKLIATFTGKKIRQFPPFFGTGSYAISCNANDVENISVDFLKKVKFTGICGAEFKYDPRDNDFKMIEVNIRPQTWEDLTRVAGREIVWIAYCDLADLDVSPLGPQKNGAVWTYLMRDVFSGFWHVRNGNEKLVNWISSYVKRIDTDALIDFKDLHLLARLPIYALKELFHYKIKNRF